MILTRNRLTTKETQKMVAEQIAMILDSKGIGNFELVDISFRFKKLEGEEGYS